MQHHSRHIALRGAILLAFCGINAAIAGQPGAKEPPLAAAVIRVGMTVEDLDRSLEFYTRVLDFKQVAEEEVAGDAAERLDGIFGLRKRVARLVLGAEEIELTDYLAPEGRPIPADSRSNDGWFQHIAIVTPRMAEAYARLRKHKARHTSPGPQRLPEWNRNAGGIEAFYFKDPDGHVLEIIQFPAGKGDPRWLTAAGERPGDLFLGIDHTAIVVADTDASLRFYRDVLGMIKGGESENYGIEQERLNNVFGARLRITSLRAGAGPAIEFLEYLAPSTGRAYPADSSAADLWHWQTTIRASDAAGVEARLRAASVAWISPGFAEIANPGGGPRRAMLIRDPDGHALQLIQE